MLQSVANLKLAEIGFAKGLDPLIYKNPSQVGAVSAKPMALTVEALLGAVFMDSGKSADAVRRVMAELGLAWPALPN